MDISHGGIDKVASPWTLRGWSPAWTRATVTLRGLKHWCASVLNKRFLTPFHDGIWNRRQVSVGDRGVLPTRPKNRRGYALLAHTFGKMRSCATDEHSNTEIRTVELKNTIIWQNCFRSQVHPTQSVPAKRFRSYVHPTQSLQGKRFRSQVHHTQFFPLNRLRY